MILACGVALHVPGAHEMTLQLCQGSLHDIKHSGQASRPCWAALCVGRGCLYTHWRLSVSSWQMDDSCKLLMHVLTLGCADVQGRWSVLRVLYRLVCALISLSEPSRGFQALRNFGVANEHPLVVQWKLFFAIDFALMMYTTTVMEESGRWPLLPALPWQCAQLRRHHPQDADVYSPKCPLPRCVLGGARQRAVYLAA